MDKRHLKGSERRDDFKWGHKQQPFPSSFYACDIDFCLITHNPPGIVALLDVKFPSESVTFAEVIAYNNWIAVNIPVYIIEARDSINGPFTVRPYLGGDWHHKPPIVQYGRPIVCNTRQDLADWEGSIRAAYRTEKANELDVRQPQG